MRTSTSSLNIRRSVPSPTEALCCCRWRVPFGPVGEAIAIEGDTDVRKIFGLSSLSPELLLLREAAKRANKVLVWRLAGGEAATRTDENITVTARYPGTVGNTIAVKIIAPESGLEFTVQTFLDGRMVDEQQAGNDRPAGRQRLGALHRYR